jgi:hypothetical protein
MKKKATGLSPFSFSRLIFITSLSRHDFLKEFDFSPPTR